MWKGMTVWVFVVDEFDIREGAVRGRNGTVNCGWAR